MYDVSINEFTTITTLPNDNDDTQKEVHQIIGASVREAFIHHPKKPKNTRKYWAPKTSGLSGEYAQ